MAACEVKLIIHNCSEPLKIAPEAVHPSDSLCACKQHDIYLRVNKHSSQVRALTFADPMQNANLSDVLMDRAVLNDTNLKNTNMQRTVFTRYMTSTSGLCAMFQGGCRVCYLLCGRCLLS